MLICKHTCKTTRVSYVKKSRHKYGFSAMQWLKLWSAHMSASRLYTTDSVFGRHKQKGRHTFCLEKYSKSSFEHLHRKLTGKNKIFRLSKFMLI